MKTKADTIKWSWLLVLALVFGCEENEDSTPDPENFTLEAVATATPTEVEVGEIIQLDGSSSKDEGKIGYDVLWTIATKPGNSNATIQNATSSAASFTPDVAGDYEILLTIENEEKEVSSSDKVSITATNPVSMIISENITQDQVLENINPDPGQPDYLVTNNIKVAAKLTVHQGVTIHFEEATGFEIGEQGTIIAEGNETEKIIFTGVDQEAGSWAGIKVNSQAANNSISNAEILYAGGTKAGANFEKAALSLQHTTISLENT